MGSFTMLRTTVSEPSNSAWSNVNNICCVLFIVSSFPLRCSMCNGVSCSGWHDFWCHELFYDQETTSLKISQRGNERMILLATNWGENFPWGTNDIFVSFFLFFCCWDTFPLYCNSHTHKLCVHIPKAQKNCFQAFLFEQSVMQLALLPQHAFDSTKCAARWLLSPLLMHQNPIWAATQWLGWLLHFHLTTLNHKSLGKDLRNVFLQLLQCLSSKAEFALHVESHTSVCVIHSPVQIC